jgi:hypothetical protein
VTARLPASHGWASHHSYSAYQTRNFHLAPAPAADPTLRRGAASHR